MCVVVVCLGEFCFDQYYYCVIIIIGQLLCGIIIIILIVKLIVMTEGKGAFLMIEFCTDCIFVFVVGAGCVVPLLCSTFV